MPRPMKPRKVERLEAPRLGGEYRIMFEDEAQKGALYSLTTRQAIRLADLLDDLIADEEEASGPSPTG